jgi:hypothetical protein
VEAVGELDQQDADVSRHRHDHLPDVLRLRVLPAPRGDGVQLGEPVDDPGDLGPEPLLELLQGHVRVLDRVVEQRRLEGGGVEPEVRHHLGDRQGVLDEVLAGQARLALVVELGEPVRALDLAQIRLRVVGLDGPKERVDAPLRGLVLPRPQARQDPAASLGLHLLPAVHGCPPLGKASVAGLEGRLSS